MKQSVATLEIEHDGETVASKIGLPTEEADGMIRGLAGQRDIVVTLSLNERNEVLRLAIDGFKVFLGLEKSSGVYQFIVDENANAYGTVSLTIGGQQTQLESRYITDVDTAANVAREWIEHTGSSSLGTWQKQ